jgi:hypothetical protein
MFVASLVVFGASAFPSAASILTSNIALDGTQTVIEDNSRGVIHDLDNSGFVSVGDVIVGLARLDRRSQNGSGVTLDDDQQLILAYSFQVDSIQSVGPFAGIYYKPVNPAAGTGLSIKELMGSSLQPSLSSAQWAQATFALMEKQFPTINAANNPVNNTTTAGMALVNSVLGNGSGYTLDIIGGIVSSSDFFTNLIIGGPGTNIAAIQNASNSVTLGVVSGGFSNLYNVFPSGALLLPVEGDNVLTNSPTYHDYTLTGGNLFGYGSGPGNNNWDYSDKLDVNLRVQAVPEPASVALWAGLFGGLLVGRRFRRRRSQ